MRIIEFECTCCKKPFKVNSDDFLKDTYECPHCLCRKLKHIKIDFD